MNKRNVKTPFGWLTIGSQGQYLISCEFGKLDAEESGGENETLDMAEKQLGEYFQGTRREFDLLLKLEGTPFFIETWKRCAEIKYGETATYGGLAASMGKAKAARAVGAAMHANPIVIFVPCHRVVGSSGRLTGFGGGLEVKQWLLELEGASET